MVKGRPALNPRIEALEKRVKELEAAVLELTGRVTQGRRLPIPPEYDQSSDYQPQFQRWTINGK